MGAVPAPEAPNSQKKTQKIEDKYHTEKVQGRQEIINMKPGVLYEPKNQFN